MKVTNLSQDDALNPQSKMHSCLQHNVFIFALALHTHLFFRKQYKKRDMVFALYLKSLTAVFSTVNSLKWIIVLGNHT